MDGGINNIPIAFLKKPRGSLFHKKRSINQKCNGQTDIGMDNTRTVYPLSMQVISI